MRHLTIQCVTMRHLKYNVWDKHTMRDMRQQYNVWHNGTFQIQCVTQWDMSNTMCDKMGHLNTMCDTMRHFKLQCVTQWDILNTMCDNETF